MELNDTNRYPFAFGYLCQAAKNVEIGIQFLEDLRVDRLVAIEIVDGKIISTEAMDLRRRELRAQGKVTG